MIFHYGEVTPDQMKRVRRLPSLEPLWNVESEQNATNVYIVRWLHKPLASYLICSCPAGQKGLPCKHRRWVLASS